MIFINSLKVFFFLFILGFSSFELMMSGQCVSVWLNVFLLQILSRFNINISNSRNSVQIDIV